jgi:hypothetical protein
MKLFREQLYLYTVGEGSTSYQIQGIYQLTRLGSVLINDRIYHPNLLMKLFREQYNLGREGIPTDQAR